MIKKRSPLFDLFKISPFVCAPMAGLSHSAFRRLVSDFGGYSILYTEMLSTKALLNENLFASPFTKRRKQEGPVIYQLKLNGNEPVEPIINKLKSVDPFGIDINLGCPAPRISHYGGGCALFDNINLLSSTLQSVRSSWDGLLTVKCRLGKNSPQWQYQFLERLKLFEDSGIDVICVHPRFIDEKLKRSARWDLFSWIREKTSLIIIGNGDIKNSSALKYVNSEVCDALMIGRMAVVKPWIFSQMCGNKLEIDYAEVWNRFYNYTCEDFPPEKAIGRIKEFSALYAENFFFGHEFFRTVQSSPNLKTVLGRANNFFKSNPLLKNNN